MPLLLFLLSSCSFGQANFLDSSTNKTAAKTSTITLSGWESDPTEKQLLKEVLDDFMAHHPHIKVKYEVITDQYMDVIKTRLIGGRAPDVFYLDGFEAPALMNKGVLEPLDPYLTKEFDVADFDPLLLNVFKYEGKTYGLPKDFSTLALLYNKKAFEKANITEPPTTWSEFLEDARKLTIDQNRDGKLDQFGFGVAPDLARQTFMIKAFGGQLVDASGKAAFATEKGLRGLQLVIDQYQKDKSSVQPSDVGTSTGAEMFGQEKVAMVIEGPWTLPYLKSTFPNLQFGTAEVPRVNGKPGTMVYTVAYVMNKQAKNKSAAWELISYLTGKEGMKAWANKGLALPTRHSVLTEFNNQREPLRSAFIAGMTYATPWQAGESLPIIRDNFNNQFISALLGQQSLPQAMKKAQETANQAIRASQE